MRGGAGRGPEHAQGVASEPAYHTPIDRRTVSMQSAPPSASTRKPVRRLRPEVVAQLATRRTASQLEELYQRPVEELSPEEIARMKAAFFRS